MSIRSCCCLRVCRRPRPSRHRRFQSQIRRRRLPPPSRLGRLRLLGKSFPSLLLRWPFRCGRRYRPRRLRASRCPRHNRRAHRSPRPAPRLALGRWCSRSPPLAPRRRPSPAEQLPTNHDAQRPRPALPRFSGRSGSDRHPGRGWSTDRRPIFRRTPWRERHTRVENPQLHRRSLTGSPTHLLARSWSAITEASPARACLPSPRSRWRSCWWVVPGCGAAGTARRPRRPRRTLV